MSGEKFVARYRGDDGIVGADEEFRVFHKLHLRDHLVVHEDPAEAGTPAITFS